MTIAWFVGAIALSLAFALGAIFMTRAGVPNRLVAFCYTGNMAALAFVALTFVFDESSVIDIALSLALLQVPGILLLCLFEERWL